MSKQSAPIPANSNRREPMTIQEVRTILRRRSGHWLLSRDLEELLAIPAAVGIGILLAFFV